MAATVHATSLAHPLESLQQAPWFRTMKTRLARAASRVWHECEVIGERRARSHLLWLADCHDGSNPELARTLREAARRSAR